MNNDNFKKWACSLSGCDGGNVDADTWICGIEWGGGSYDNGKYYKNLSNEIQNGEVKFEKSSYDWKKNLEHTYGRNVAKLFASIQGKPVEDYRKLSEDIWKGNEIFRLNLYPIAFDSTDETLWHDFNLDEITGFSEKHLFKTWCFFNRFPAFVTLRKEIQPKLIICTGITYIHDFIYCFGGDDINIRDIKFDKINPISKTNRKNERYYYWVKLDGNKTTLVVIPFFSGSYGLNSNYLLNEMGKRIRQISS